ncbi:CcmE/CycJ protein [Candidatus Vecturithrix granuli]|uniref:CcmE/CycJ protein n=1 Tax=Vecturithrix granuli TaxID=1499967 RepID=A0A081BVE6_VECG1|nr:CcmE/CycJ protein [Candidatus Vecturithrix granuli]
MNANPTKLFLGGLLVALGIGFLLYASFQDSAMYYLTVDEFLAQHPTQKETGMRIAGIVVPGSIQRQNDMQNITFIIRGRSEQSTMSVSYKGVVPDIFRDGASIVLEGSYNAEKQFFHAITLMTSCPSKYEAKLK